MQVLAGNVAGMRTAQKRKRCTELFRSAESIDGAPKPERAPVLYRYLGGPRTETRESRRGFGLVVEHDVEIFVRAGIPAQSVVDPCGVQNVVEPETRRYWPCASEAGHSTMKAPRRSPTANPVAWSAG